MLVLWPLVLCDLEREDPVELRTNGHCENFLEDFELPTSMIGAKITTNKQYATAT